MAIAQRAVVAEPLSLGRLLREERDRRQARDKGGWSRYDMSKRLDCREKTIEQIEGGTPNWNVLPDFVRLMAAGAPRGWLDQVEDALEEARQAIVARERDQIKRILLREKMNRQGVSLKLVEKPAAKMQATQPATVARTRRPRSSEDRATVSIPLTFAA